MHFEISFGESTASKLMEVAFRNARQAQRDYNKAGTAETSLLAAQADSFLLECLDVYCDNDKEDIREELEDAGIDWITL